MIQKIILQSPTYYYYQSITHQMHGLICLNEIFTSPELEMLVSPRRSAHSDGTATALAGTIYWNSGKPEEAAILFKSAMRLQPLSS